VGIPAFKMNWPLLSDFPSGKTVLLSSLRIRDAGADNSMDSRDEGFKNQAHHKAKPDPFYDKTYPKKPTKCCRPATSLMAMPPGPSSVRPASCFRANSNISAEAASN
jgi:hypothetical protein